MVAVAKYISTRWLYLKHSITSKVEVFSISFIFGDKRAWFSNLMCRSSVSTNVLPLL